MVVALVIGMVKHGIDQISRLSWIDAINAPHRAKGRQNIIFYKLLPYPPILAMATFLRMTIRALHFLDAELYHSKIFPKLI